MRLFSLLDFQTVILLSFLGLIGLLLLWIAFRSPGFQGRHGRKEVTEDYPDGIRAGNGAIPPLLVFVYVAFLIWAIAYVVVIGTRGAPF